MQGLVYETALSFNLNRAECLHYTPCLESSVQGKEIKELSTEQFNLLKHESL